MAGTRQNYPAEFKADAVRQVQSSARPVAEIARDLDVNPRTLRGWVAAAERTAAGSAEAARGAASDAMREELAALRAESEHLKAENAELRRQLEMQQRSRPADAYRLRKR